MNDLATILKYAERAAAIAQLAKRMLADSRAAVAKDHPGDLASFDAAYGSVMGRLAEVDAAAEEGGAQ